MKTKLIVLFLALFMLVGFAYAADTKRRVSVVPKSSGERKIALVIGNGNYKTGPLRNPVNDAKLMASTLRELGFDVDERTNLSMNDMKEVIDRFGRKIQGGGIALFYYAGHGMQVKGNNYLVPVDADIKYEAEVDYKAVNAGLVLAQLEGVNNPMNIVILDACRDNPFARSWRSASRGLAQMSAPVGTIVAYATAPGSTASDGSGRNGLYTDALVRQMRVPGQKIEDVFKKVRTAVKNNSGGQQVPWESSSLEGDFYFAGGSGSESQQTYSRPQTYQPEPQQQVAMAPRPERMESSYSDPTTGMDFVYVNGGCYQMGDTFGDGYDSEKPVHEACVDDYYIGKYEVTQGQWQAVMGSNPSNFKNCGDNCPVESVSWNDAQEFVRKLNQRSGGGKYRLPTEAEWEYAARSGGKSEKYSGGNDVDSVAWYSGNSGSKTHPVGTKSPNGLGIYDMSGNVWEWVQDWYGGGYSSGSQNNPSGPSSGSYRVYRGGSWGYGARDGRAAYRDSDTPGDRRGRLGFRLARTR
jgi:formylglycine-generating enzyme required for sulfatase activity